MKKEVSLYNYQQIHWVLQCNLIKESVLAQLIEALEHDNISYETVKIIPFSDEVPDIVATNPFKIFYGSTTLILNAYARAQYREGIFYEKEVFSMKNYITQWQDKMLNFDSSILTFNEIVNGSFTEGEWFVRPIYDDKAFSGRVMSMEDIKKLEASLATSNNPYLNEETLVSIAKPKSIKKEWRHFIVDKEIVSSSRYAENGQPSKSGTDVPDDLLAFVKACCQQYVPNDIFVIDTALVNDTYKIVECNCFNDTGFYDHDIQKIISAVNRFITKKIGS